MPISTDTAGLRIPIIADYRMQPNTYAFKIGESGGMSVISQVWIVGFGGALARVDGGDPGDENDGE